MHHPPIFSILRALFVTQERHFLTAKYSYELTRSWQQKYGWHKSVFKSCCARGLRFKESFTTHCLTPSLFASFFKPENEPFSRTTNVSSETICDFSRIKEAVLATPSNGRLDDVTNKGERYGGRPRKRVNTTRRL